MERVKVAIVGASGYAGGELARLLLAHPHVDLTYVTSGTYAGQPLETALPGLRGTGLVCEAFDPSICADKCDFVFLAGETGLAMQAAPLLLEAGKKIVDLSADFRLHDDLDYEEWYKTRRVVPHLSDMATYGLPETNRASIATAQLVANPGCHVTAAVLALAPLLKYDLIDWRAIVINSLSGVSGAGRSKFGLDYHFSEVNESMRPYGVGGVHRHTPEIEQCLSQIALEPVIVSFTPHLVPVTRGILSTCNAPLTPDSQALVNLSETTRHGAFVEYYKDDPFIVILDEGQFPATKHVTGTNNCHIGIAVDKRTNRVIVVSAIDNLGKGAAGQAVQNMNLMCGFPETSGLTGGAMWP